jgi:putative ABC transport system permease protein
MLKFVLLKLLNKKWMVLALLIGNILLISVVGAGVMYSDAALQRSLNQRFRDTLATDNVHPCMIVVNTNYTYKRAAVTYQTAERVKNLPQTFGLPATQIVEYYSISPTKATAVVDRENGITTNDISVGTMVDLENHIEIVAGRMFEPQPDKDGIVDLIVSHQGLMDMNLLLDECFTLRNIEDDAGNPIVFRVCGVFRSNSASDPYWVVPPSDLSYECLMDEALFRQIFKTDGRCALNSRINVLLDFTAITTEQASALLQTADETVTYYKEQLRVGYRDTFRATLEQHLISEKQITVAIWVLQVPVFALLAAFLFMVSRQILEMEQNEIAVLKSRGASRWKILGVYLIQSTLICLIAMAAGLPLSALLVQILGSSNAFLEFVGRTALPLRFTGKVLALCAATAVLSIGAMVLPAFRFADVSIVNHMQRKHRKSNAPLWQKMCLDLLLLGVSLYGLYSYNNQKDLLASNVLNGGTMDPLMFICSSLFILGAALLALRIIPAITYVVFRLFRKWWSPSLYTTFLQLIRNRHGQTFVVVFLIMTMALGIFNAQTARTINHYAAENIQYTAGADIVIQEKWRNNLAQVVAGKISPEELTYFEPDYSRYEALVGNGAAGVTPVLTIQDGKIRQSGKFIEDVQLMSIDPPTFGPIVWMKDELLKHHIYEYLNAMSSQKEGILISRNMQEEFGLQVGDTLAYYTSFYNQGDLSSRGVICGIVDYWPSYNPVKYRENSDGTFVKVPNYLIVTNISYLNGNKWPQRPYEVWIDAESGTDFIYDFIAGEEVPLEGFIDTPNQIVRLKNDPLFQGSNGVLTVSFVVALILCSVGFLIYWILSIKARSLQFGIYRAMGMSMREVLSMLFGEQIFISGTSIGAGILVGSLAAKLYIPLIQIAYSDAGSALPLVLVSENSDLLRILIVVGSVMLVCMVILGWLISKLKITQALKLGED